MPLSNDRIRAVELVQRAVQLRRWGSDQHTSEIETCLNEALQLDPQNIEALQEAARFYDSVAPGSAKARECAAACRNRAQQAVVEMETILREGGSRNPPVSRHIGGIIGPY